MHQELVLAMTHIPPKCNDWMQRHVEGHTPLAEQLRDRFEGCWKYEISSDPELFAEFLAYCNDAGFECLSRMFLLANSLGCRYLSINIDADECPFLDVYRWA